MATLNAYTPFNANTFSLFEGDITAATPTYLQVVRGAQVQELIGSGFDMNVSGDIIAGTLTQTNYSLGGAPQYEMAGLNHSLVTITGLFDADDWQGVLAFLFAGNDSFNGSNGNDVLNSYAGDDSLFAGSGNDIVRGQQGNDTLDGGAGIDTALYSGSRAGYTVAKIASGYSVDGADGVDALTNVERAQFSDKSLAFDLGTGQPAGNTVRVIGAAFDAPIIQQHPEYVGIGLQFFDAGMSMLQVCALVAQLMGQSNTTFVSTVFFNVVGFAPDAVTQAAFVSLLQGDGGQMTQGQLLEFAATIDLNAANIDLVGLQQTGIEFT